MAFQDKFRELRVHSRLSQEQLATRLNVSRQAISKWETGSVPDVDNMVKIAKFFDCSLDYLMDLEKEKQPSELPEEKQPLIRMSPEGWAALAAWVAIIILVILWLISRFVDVGFTRQDIDTEKWYIGFQAFVEYYGIYPLVYGCVGGWILGMTVRFAIHIKRNRYSANKQYFVCRILAYVLSMIATLEWIMDFHKPGGFIGWNGGGYVIIGIYLCVILGLEYAAKRLESSRKKW